jgi:hypothetical protein
MSFLSPRYEADRASGRMSESRLSPGGLSSPPTTPKSPPLRTPGGSQEQSPNSRNRLGTDAEEFHEELLQLLKSGASPSASGEVKMLLSRNLIMGTKALQGLSAEKEELVRELSTRTDQLHAAEASLKASEDRAGELEDKLNMLRADLRAAVERVDR